MSDNLDAILNERAAAIPQTILVLYKLAKMRRRSNSPAKARSAETIFVWIREKI